MSIRITISIEPYSGPAGTKKEFQRRSRAFPETREGQQIMSLLKHYCSVSSYKDHQAVLYNDYIKTGNKNCAYMAVALNVARGMAPPYWANDVVYEVCQKISLFNTAEINNDQVAREAAKIFGICSTPKAGKKRAGGWSPRELFCRAHADEIKELEQLKHKEKIIIN